MIDVDELRIKQSEFEATRQDFHKELKKLESKRVAFLKVFPQEKTKDLTLEKYVLGTEISEDSFCYWMEIRLKDLGNMYGSRADKFGIYFGKIKSDSTLKYRFASKFGDNKIEAFQNVKKSIVELLDSAKNEDIRKIRENLISPMFKGKILSTYYPEKYLNIFSDEHLEYFLDKLDIQYNDFDDEIIKRNILFNFKNNDLVMEEWTIYEFSKFLYEKFGMLPKKENAHEALKKYIQNKKDYPNLKDVKAEFIDFQINPENLKFNSSRTRAFTKTIDFEKENHLNKLLGNRGEEIVFDKEKKYLESNGNKELADKVDWVSKKGKHFLGYDILSFEENGEEKYIEVKSTKQSYTSNANFIISSNEYEKAKKLENYYFYIVFNTQSENPKIWKIKNPMNYENKGLTLTPINYRVLINKIS